MRSSSDQWASRFCLIVPVCKHQPPRLGLVITKDTASAEPDLQRRIRDAALDARASETLSVLPALDRLIDPLDLSARQIAILSRVIKGERIPEIANYMFLSPSTVRNHLSAIYRKFGVHSQAELLATILRAQSRDAQD